MAILNVVATANDTLDSATDVLLDSMTLTPASDDYLLFFTATVEVPATVTNGGQTIFSVFVGGTEVTATETEYEQASEVFLQKLTVSTHCKISPNGSQAVEIKYRGVNATPCVCKTREMTLFPIPAAGTDYVATSQSTYDTTNTSYATVTGMSISSPTADDYLLLFSAGVDNSGGDHVKLRIQVGGVTVAETDRWVGNDAVEGQATKSITIACKVSPTGAQDVIVQAAATSSRIWVYHRRLSLIPFDAGDIFEATDTVADADSTTTDKLIDSMTVSAPGATDYLAIFSGVDFVTTTTGTSATTYSLRVDGTKVTNSGRETGRDNQVDGIWQPVICGGKITVGASQDVAAWWQADSTDTRSIDERSLILIREFGTGSGVTITDVNLVALTGAPRASLSSLKWSWFDVITPATFVAPIDQGTAEATDGSGNITLSLTNSILTSGQEGLLVLEDSGNSFIGAYRLAVD